MSNQDQTGISNSSAPFFIVGCGRSGTSLLRSILDAHSTVAIPTESLFLIDYLRAQERLPLNLLVDLMVREPELKEWGFAYDRHALASSHSIPDLIEKLHNLYAQSRRKIRWGQKTPRFIRSLDLLAASFPAARFIHIVRDPRAVVSSLIESDVHRSDPLHGARRWRRDVEAGLAFEQEHPERILRISYEQLVSQPRPTVEAVSAFLGLTFEPGMLERKSGREDYGDFYANIHAHLDQEFNVQHRDKWRRRLGSQEIALVESVADGLMQQLGYEAQEGVAPPSKLWLASLQGRRLVNLIPQFLRYLRYRRGYLFFLVYRKQRMGILKEFLWTIHY